MENPLLNYAGYLLRQAAKRRLAQLAQHLEPIGVGVSEASMLVLIGRNPGISQTECGRMLSVQPPNLNPITRRLIERKLIDSTKGRGRALCLTLTGEGARLMQRIVGEFEVQEARIYRVIPEHLRHDLVPLLRALQGPP
ncbi:MAG: MarR family transcriptional regulator [Bradyrhizobium sp.]|nr:MarR family transcriptional regulator [Bradyrhizobium sp.]